MIYRVKHGDTLWTISRRFGTTISDLLDANVICNPELIFPGQLLIIPLSGLNLPKAGGSPYYIVYPGDTLWCLAKQFDTSVELLANANNIADPNLIFPGNEILIAYDIPNPEQLKQQWEVTAEQYCGSFNSLQVYGIYYLGTFRWEAIGEKAIPYLIELIDNPCFEVKYYAVISLGRIAQNGMAKEALNKIPENSEIYDISQLALQRIELAENKRKRVHLTVGSTFFYNEPLLNTPYKEIPNGTKIIVEKWFIPSPIGEDLPPAGLAVWDYVRIIETGETGFLSRVGYSQTPLI